LGEIDLSAGFVAGIGGVVMAELVKQGTDWPWWAAIAVALLATAAIGAFQGTLITRIGLPSFVVTLAGLLGWQGVMLLILGQGGGDMSHLGVPYVVFLVHGVLVAWTCLMGRNKFGRYVYAIGGNPESARRAGVSLSLVRTICFALASFSAGIAGIVYATRRRS